MRRNNFFSDQLALFLPQLKPKPSKDNLPILYPNNISYSSANVLKFCQYRYWLQHPGNWRGWEIDAPPLIQEAYWHKRLAAWQGWAGNLVHEFTAGTLFNRIDREIFAKTGVLPKSDEQRLMEIKQRFEGEWNQSLDWNWSSFKKIPRSDKPVWLQHHALRQPDWNEVNDQRLKRRAWNWVEQSIFNVIQQIGQYHDYSAYDQILIIEGMKLKQGLVTQDPDSEEKSQVALRSEKLYPRFELELDGEVWNYLFAIDLMIFTPKGKYLIIDFKTGQEKNWGFHRDQLYRYAAFILQQPEQFVHLDLPKVEMKNLKLRIVYTDPAAYQPIRSFNLRYTFKSWLYKKAAEDIKLLRQHLIPLKALDDLGRASLRQMLSPRLHHGPAGLYKRDGVTLREGIDPNSLVALPEDFTPTAAEKGWHGACKSCSGLPLCQRGQELLALIKKR